MHELEFCSFVHLKKKKKKEQLKNPTPPCDLSKVFSVLMTIKSS